MPVKKRYMITLPVCFHAIYQVRKLSLCSNTNLQQRRLAFTLAREGLESVLDDLDLSDSSNDDVEQGDTTLDDNEALLEERRFDDAKEDLPIDQAEDASLKAKGPVTNENATASTKNQKARRQMPKRIRKKVPIRIFPCHSSHADDSLTVQGIC